MGMPKGRSGNPAGRPPGIKSKKSQLAEAALSAMIKSKKTPLDFLLTVMASAKIPLPFRLDAAKAAAPYVHKRMPQAVEVSGELNHHHRGGVMVVPAVESTENWAVRAAGAQAKLKEEVRH